IRIGNLCLSARRSRRPTARQRRRPDAENFGGEGLFLTSLHIIRSTPRRVSEDAKARRCPVPLAALGWLPNRTASAAQSVNRLDWHPLESCPRTPRRAEIAREGSPHR